MPVPMVAGNWKMNTSVAEAIELSQVLVDSLGLVQGIDVVLCPPFISLEAVSRVLQSSSIELGAQNMHYQEKGAFTGEISPMMLSGLCRYVILGHSERRQHFAETDRLINLKVKAAFESSLLPILCVGEVYQQRQNGTAAQVVENQIKSGLDSLHNVSGLVVAYEPVWAIGTGEAATPEIATEMMGGVILRALTELFGTQTAGEVPLLYGGSVNAENVEAYMQEGSIHGALVGGASLRADQFTEIVRVTSRVKGDS